MPKKNFEKHFGKNLEKILAIFLPLFYYLLFAGSVSAASLSLSPAMGEFEVGNVLETSILLDSEGSAVNALNVELRFPAEKLQLITPTTGNSIISLWTAQPSVDNNAGILRMQGVTPGGVNVSQGLVTRLRFRVRAPGDAYVKFSDTTRILLHDGAGTDVLRDTSNAVFSLRLPPPLGPVVVSPTHPDQTRWYSTKTSLLQWTTIISEVTGFSYVLNEDPVDLPDDISEGKKQSVTYKDLSDAVHYFHVKSLQGSSWGGITHFTVRVDTTPPAEFPVDILPGERTSERTPIVQFFTTDVLSGIDHYELKVISLSPRAAEKNPSPEPLYVEARSPFILPELSPGNFDILVRAYDKAENYREETKRLSVTTPFSENFDDKGAYIWEEYIPWWVLFIILFLIICILFILARILKKWRKSMEHRRMTQVLPQKVTEQLEELKEYHKRYGKLAVLLLFALSGIFLDSGRTFAQEAESERLPPPLFESVSRDITNEDIFYAGGRTTASNIEVILYVQNARSGEILSKKITSNKEGEWFYRHDTFLAPGVYTLWAQAKAGDQVSPPSPEQSINVRETVLQIGSSRFSYDFLYLALIALLLCVILALLLAILIHWRHGKRLHMLWMKEVREAEDAVRNGFAELRHDIEVELGLLKKLSHSRAFSEEEEKREKELLSDLEKIENTIGKEVLDIERALL